ncbi:N-acylneuraminate-9-phosphatase [Diabrotica undecimpunctata]|uniref:N-acylneuraminate-9-phosphatase n=1 Tax=Diabrotica undecimpunctata TaxID=50387 RepID=UPI003B63B687
MEDRKSKIEAIFFDLDNTLIQTRKADEKTCDKIREILIKHYSVSLEKANKICKRYLKMFRQCPENSAMDLHEWRILLWKEALGDKYIHLSNEIYQHWLDLRYKYMSITPEIRNLLQTLSDQYILALITNGTSNAQWEKVDKLNIRPFFDLILVSGDLPWEKPHSQIFLEACHHLSIEPHQVVMVGDKLETDILGSINSKLGASIWLPLNNEKLSIHAPKPDFIIKEILDLHNLMSKINIIKQGFTLQFCDVEDSSSNSSDGS